MVDLRRADPKLDPSPADYDLVVVGGSIHAGRHQHDIVKWARHHAVARFGRRCTTLVPTGGPIPAEVA